MFQNIMLLSVHSLGWGKNFFKLIKRIILFNWWWDVFLGYLNNFLLIFSKLFELISWYRLLCVFKRRILVKEALLWILEIPKKKKFQDLNHKTIWEELLVLCIFPNLIKWWIGACETLQTMLPAKRKSPNTLFAIRNLWMMAQMTSSDILNWSSSPLKPHKTFYPHKNRIETIS